MSALATFSTLRNVARGAATAWKADAALTTRPRAIRVRMADRPGLRARAQHAGHDARAGDQALERAAMGDEVGERDHEPAAPLARELGDGGQVPARPGGDLERRLDPGLLDRARTASSQSGRVIT